MLQHIVGIPGGMGRSQRKKQIVTGVGSRDIILNAIEQRFIQKFPTVT